MRTGRLPIPERRPTTTSYSRTPPGEAAIAATAIVENGGNSPLVTASNIARAAMRTRSSRISLYSCSTRRPRDCRPWSGDFDLTHLNYEVEVGSDRLEVQLDRYSSLYLEGLSGVEVVIGGRSKHVTSIDCRDLTLELGEAPIVGIYLLRSSGVDVQVGGQHPLGYFGLESCETTTLRARLEVGFTFTSYNSMGVTLNGARLLINPFDVGSWVWTGGNFHRRPGAGSRGGNLTLTLPYYEGNETVFGMEV